MNIELKMIPLREIYDGYLDDGELGVKAYDDKLNIRPPYQREFIYKDKERNEVIKSVRGGYPIGIMYWAKTGNDTYEVLDGQQRTMSLMEYLDGNFSVDIDGSPRNFYNLTDEEQEELLDYSVMVYLCDGTEAEKLKWFQVVNIAGEPLTKQEIRNSIYTGPWLHDAKRFFSKVQGPAYDLGGKYLRGTANRQDYLETALSWISNRDGISIEEYMSQHQNDPSANELWLYFTNVLNWIEQTFRVYRKEMKGLDWGLFFNKYKDITFDPEKLETMTKELMEDDEVQSKKGVYEYLLTGNENKLNLRKFPLNMKREAYERQNGICAKCGEKFEFNEMEADHITPWSQGGKTVQENLQMLCKDCNRRKSDK